MNKEWFSVQEVAGLIGLPKTAQGVRLKADKEIWESRKKSKGKGFEYHITSLPPETQNYLAKLAIEEQTRIAKDQAKQAGLEFARKLSLETATKCEVTARKREQIMAKAAHLQGKDKQRFESKIIMLELWQSYLEKTTKGTVAATYDFLAMWHHDTLNLAEDLRWMRDFIDPKLCYQTLRNWKNDPEKLLPKYGKRKNTGIIDTTPELKEFVIATIFEFPGIKQNLLKDAVDSRFRGKGVRLPSEKTLGRWVKNYIKENQQAYNAVTHPDKWRNNNLPAFGTLAVDALNALWQLDSTPADIMLVDGRYNILGAIDIYSRRMKLIVSKTSTSEAVANLVRHCLLDWGVPKTIKTDNGKDYISIRTKTALKSIGVEQVLSQPFSPWEKGNVERMFRSFSHSLLELMPGFSGHNVAEKSAIENRKQFSERLFKKDTVIEVNMTSEELQNFANRWIDDVYMHRPHGGEEMDGKTPFERVIEWPEPVQKIKNERALDILLSDVGKRTVGKNGIRLDGMIYIAPELGSLVGDIVLIRKDPDCVGTIYVFKGSEFVCIAEDTRYVGIRRQDIAQKARQNAMSVRKELKKQIRTAQSSQKVKDIAEEILQDKHTQNNVSMLPKRTEDYTNDMLDAAAEAASQMASIKNEKPEALKPIKVSDVAEMPMVKNPQEVHKRYLRLKSKLEKGVNLNQEDNRFYNWYHGSNECRNMQEFFEDFGLLNTINE